MSVRIRLRRVGAKKQPSYRLVVADSRAPRDGRFLAVVGHYNPRRNPAELVLQEEAIRGWLQRGAQPSEPVARLLASAGLYERSKVRLRQPRESRKKSAS